jgi:hypothetical protein
MPTIAGPYTTVSATLRQTGNSIRINTDLTGGYPQPLPGGTPDPRFMQNNIQVTSIATSSAQNDSGLFELIFRDERYLPFEGSGVISSWQFGLATAVQQFDYSTISDVILHIKYTAQEGDVPFKTAAETNINDRINKMLVSATDQGLMRYFSGRHDFSNEWYQFLNAPAGQDQVLTLNIPPERFPYFAQKISGKNLAVTGIELFADTNAPYTPFGGLVLTAPGSTKNLAALATGPVYGNLLYGGADYSAAPELTGSWALRNPAANPVLTRDVINDVIIVVHYKLV